MTRVSTKPGSASAVFSCRRKSKH